jgi:iron complex transport system substrate-binding protein
MGPPPVLAQIRKAGVRVEQFSSKAELAAVDENLKHLGQLLGAEQQAAVLASGYHQKLDAFQAKVRQAQAGQKAPGVLLLVGHAGARPLIAGQGTAGDWLLSQAGGRNLAEHQGYRNFSSEALAALDPDVIVFSDRALADEQALQALLKENPALAASRAVREKRLVSLDPTLLVGGLGPRLPATLQSLAATFYPAAKASLVQ